MAAATRNPTTTFATAGWGIFMLVVPLVVTAAIPITEAFVVHRRTESVSFLHLPCSSLLSSTTSSCAIESPRKRRCDTTRKLLDSNRRRRSTLVSFSSLFDEIDDVEDDNNRDSSSSPVARRKFTGAGRAGDFYSGKRGGNSGGGGEEGGTRVRRDEYNLVRAATSPEAFLLQAAAIFVLGAFMVFVAATGQLGSNNDYFDDEEDGFFGYNYDGNQNTVLVQPSQEEPMPQENKPTVWI